MSPAIRSIFPSTCPEITICPSDESIGAIDFPELRWWFLLPEVGDRTAYAAYDTRTNKLDYIRSVIDTVPAEVHGEPCVRIRLDEWTRERGLDERAYEFHARMDEVDESQFLAVTSNGRKTTRRDAGFQDDWGGHSTRLLVDNGRFKRQSDGSYRTTGATGIGAGVYEVRIGSNTYRCLRVIDADTSIPRGGELVEAYVAESGRTVFFRRYDGRFWRGVDLLDKCPDALRIVIDGITYIHHDCTWKTQDTLTTASLGL